MYFALRHLKLVCYLGPESVKPKEKDLLISQRVEVSDHFSGFL